MKSGALVFVGVLVAACGSAPSESGLTGADSPSAVHPREASPGSTATQPDPVPPELAHLPKIPFGYLAPAACEARPASEGARHPFACVAERFTPAGRYAREERDVLGRITFDARYGPFETTKTHSYDDAGRLVGQVQTSGGSYRRDTWRYDAAGGLVEHDVETGTSAAGVTWRQRRVPVLDDQGRVDYLRHETNGAVEASERTDYAYDAAGRLTAIHHDGESYEEAWQYHPDGSRASYLRANYGAGYRREDYDPSGRLVATKYEDGAGGGWTKRVFEGENLVEETGESSKLHHSTWRRVRQYDGHRPVLEWYADDVTVTADGRAPYGLRHASRYIYSCEGDLLRIEKDENWDGAADEVRSFVRDAAGSVMREETRNAAGERSHWIEYDYACHAR